MSRGPEAKPSVGIVVIACNAASTALATLRRLVRNVGFDILEEPRPGCRWGVVVCHGGASGLIRRVDDGLVRVRPTLLGYQYILQLTPHAEDVVHADELVPLEAGGEFRAAALT